MSQFKLGDVLRHKKKGTLALIIEGVQWAGGDEALTEARGRPHTGIEANHRGLPVLCHSFQTEGYEVVFNLFEEFANARDS
jgi:hypothetical protein